MRHALKSGVSDFLNAYPPKAAQLIVTIYGDIVEPRSGVLWMGDLISLCSDFGVNESLVRTAVSRLVSKGQLSGQREGRRSYYGLTPTASAEFHSAGDLFFGRTDGECDWLIAYCPDLSDQIAASANGFASIGGDMFMAADRPGRTALGSVFRSVAMSPSDEKLKQLARSVFELDTLSTEYADIVQHMGNLNAVVDDIAEGREALNFRLALIHAYRNIRFRDPRLPVSVLPPDWPGFEAHRLFAEIYCKLSVFADPYIGQQLQDNKGSLPLQPQSVKQRLNSLAARNEPG